MVAGNKIYARKAIEQDPQFFKTLATGQSPEILWIGCADSRVPETTVCDCKPGDIFVHRNIANVVVPTDVNTLAVVEFAVAYVKVKHIILCGHTSCAGCAATRSRATGWTATASPTDAPKDWR